MCNVFTYAIGQVMLFEPSIDLHLEPRLYIQ